MSSPYPGAAFSGASPGRPPSGSSAERTARLVAAVITVLALVGVLLVAVITSDKGSVNGLGDTGQQNVPGGSVNGSSGGGGDSGVGPAASAAAPTAVTSGIPSESVPSATSSADFPSASVSSSAPTTPTAAQIRKNFPVPPGTTPISKYDFLKPEPGDLWYLTTTSIAATNRFYVTKFKAGGWITYISPSVTKNSAGKPVGYFYIYHLDSKVTTDLQMDSNYLGKAPGKVLIRVTVSDE